MWVGVPWKVREMRKLTRTTCFRLNVSQKHSRVGEQICCFKSNAHVAVWLVKLYLSSSRRYRSDDCSECIHSIFTLHHPSVATTPPKGASNIPYMAYESTIYIDCRQNVSSKP